MNTRTSLVILAAALCSAGCAQQQKKTPSAATATKGSVPAAQVDFSSAVIASSLRERAITTIEELARSADPVARANAVEAAGRSAGRLRAVIERGLTDPNTGVRSVAAMTIGKAQVKDLAERARALLDDPSVFARMAAIFALAANKRQVDPTSLADILLTDPSINARSQAAFILGELRNPSSQPLLRQAMRQTPSSATPEQAKVFQLQVAEALIKLGDDDQRTGVRAALYPSRPEELEAAALAAQILGQVADRKSIDGLVYLSEYKDQNGNPNPAEVRLAVAASLMSMGLKGGEAITDQYANAKEPAIRAQAAYGYGVMGGNHGLNHLATLLADPEPLVRVAAADGILRALER